MKRTSLIAGVAAGMVVLATVFIAAAQTTPPASTSVATVESSQQPVLQVGPAGKVLMRGTIASTASGVLTVNSWGGVWTVNVGAGAKVLPASAGTDVTQLKAGDFVGIQGTVSKSGSWTIDATLVRDWTYRQAVNQERRQNVKSAETTIRSGTAKNFVGTASNVSGSSFTLTAESATYTVNVTSETQVINRNWLTLPLASVKSGDNVRVWGVNASGTITAKIVRDVSIPAIGTAH